MKIIIDLLHPAHLNFFINAIAELKRQEIEVSCVYRSRGDIKLILDHELPNVKTVEVGKHHKSLPGKIMALFHREYQLLRYLKTNDFDLAMGVAGFYIGFPARIQAKSAVTFTDDWEYKTTFYLSKYGSDYLVIPRLIPAGNSRILKYPGYKELAYLHPEYYKPSDAEIKKAGIKPENYVFIRLVSSASMNYINLTTKNLKKLFTEIKNEGYEIVLSSEEPNKELEKLCYVLKPPVIDIHSWIANAALTISFGDTMARESVLVGTPSIYLGRRDMAVNKEFISMGSLLKIDNNPEILPNIRRSLNENLKKRTKTAVSAAYAKGKWADTTNVIVDISKGILEDNKGLINKYKNIS